MNERADQNWRHILATAVVELTILRGIETALSVPVVVFGGDLTMFSIASLIALVFFLRRHFLLVALLVLAYLGLVHYRVKRIIVK